MKKLFIFILLFTAIITTYAVWQSKDISQLEAFCDAVVAGTDISQLPKIAQTYGVNHRYVVRDGIYDEKEKNWFLAVPAASSMGETACVIRHDKKKVQSANLISHE